MSSKRIYGVSPSSTFTAHYNYLYRITNVVENKHYYGIRTSKNILPQDDLGKKYFSSSLDKTFINDQKEHPENYKYKIVAITETREQATKLEIFLHTKFEVSKNPKFYNRAIQTSTGFNPLGKVSVIDNEGNHFYVSNTDPKFLDGTLISTSTGLVSVKDEMGNFLRVPKTDERYQNGSLVSTATGMLNVKDEFGNIFGIPVTDHRVVSGQLKHHSSGTLTVRDEFRNIFVTSVDNPLYLSGSLKYVNNAFKHYKKTPWGIFESLKVLEPEINRSTLHGWCGPRNNTQLTKKTYYWYSKLQETFGPDCIGKTYKELGFGLLTPEKYEQLQLSNS